MAHAAGAPLTPAVAAAVEALWASGDAGLQAAFASRRAFDGHDNAPYFFARATELARAGYLPTEDDMLRARVRTRGTVEGEFNVGEQRLHVIDVGGQRNEREKWVKHFEDVRAVVFVASLAEYDLAAADDPSRNRLVEALGLFHWAANHPSFRRAAMVLVLNKRDVFEEKIRAGSPLKSVAEGRFVDFPDARGPSPDAALHYLRERFRVLASHRLGGDHARGVTGARVERMKLFVTSAVDKRPAFAKFFDGVKEYVADERLHELLRPEEDVGPAP